MCNVIGGRFTVWRGSVIAAGCEVTLVHAQFGTSAAFGVCNNGAVVGRGTRVDNSCYSSQLSVYVSPDLDGRTIDCSVDDGREVSLINSTTLLLSRGSTTASLFEPVLIIVCFLESFLPPTNVQLADANPRELTFTWTPPSQYCPSLTFNIITENCGTCQNTTSLTNTTCENYGLSIVCTFMIQSVICGNLISSNQNNPVTVNLNGMQYGSLVTNIIII